MKPLERLQIGMGNVEWVALARLALAAALALAVTNLGLPQAAPDPLVNAWLLLTVEALGVSQAIVVGMLTPMGAALRGILPLPLVVMIPFIALGNATLVGVYGTLRRSHRGVVLVCGAVAKFAVLYVSVALLRARPLVLAGPGGIQPVAIPEALWDMMRWPQLATALAGGVLALGVVGLYRWASGRVRGRQPARAAAGRGDGLACGAGGGAARPPRADLALP